MKMARFRKPHACSHQRKFFDLMKAHNSPIATEAVHRIAALYRIEKEIKDDQQTNAAPFALHAPGLCSTTCDDGSNKLLHN